MLSLLTTSTWCKVSRAASQGLRLVSRLWSLLPPPAPPTLPSSVCLHHRPASSLSSQPPWCGGKNPSFRIRKKKTKNQKPELKFWFYPGCDFGQVIYLTSWCLSSMGTHITLPLTPWSMGRIRADDSEAGGPPKLLPG